MTAKMMYTHKETPQRRNILKVKVLTEEYDLGEILFAFLFILLAYLSGFNINLERYLPASLAMGEVIGILVYVWKADL